LGYNENVLEREAEMEKRASLVLFVLAALTAGAVVSASSFRTEPWPGQGQKARPEFYVARVVSSQDVKNPNEVLGKPDGRCAEVAPGGQMVLLMEKPIIPSSGFDDGLVVCVGEADYGLEGLFLVGGTKDAPEYAWMVLSAGNSPGSFRLAYQDLTRTPEGSPGVTRIRISNNGTKPLLIDAVVGYGRPPDSPSAS
jgi:hypothetical protein